jgi:hypothetical protein
LEKVKRALALKVYVQTMRAGICRKNGPPGGILRKSFRRPGNWEEEEVFGGE